ncbi:hypothetical protein BC828DRAFT_382247 [Blastocladiella britannica]|nr:hypothetical protein BC828DRAFT_382247 [Blastocladiella britannica]
MAIFTEASSCRFQEAVLDFKVREGSVSASASRLPRQSIFNTRLSAVHAAKFPPSDPLKKADSGSDTLHAAVPLVAPSIPFKNCAAVAPVGGSSSTTLVGRNSLEREMAATLPSDPPIASSASGISASHGHATLASGGDSNAAGSPPAMIPKSALATQSVTQIEKQQSHELGKLTLVMPTFKALEPKIPMQRENGRKQYSAPRRLIEIPFHKHVATLWLSGSLLKHNPVAFAKEKIMADRMAFRVNVSIPILHEMLAQGPMKDSEVLPAISFDLKRMQVMMAFCARDTEYARRLMRKEYHSSIGVRAAHACNLLAQCTAMDSFHDYHGAAAYLVAIALEVDTSYLSLDIFSRDEQVEFARMKVIYLNGPQPLLARYAELRRDGIAFIPFMQPVIAELTAIKAVEMLGTPAPVNGSNPTGFQVRLAHAKSALMAHRSCYRKEMEPLLPGSNSAITSQMDMLLWPVVEQSPLLI